MTDTNHRSDIPLVSAGDTPFDWDWPRLHKFLETEIKAAQAAGNDLASHLTAALKADERPKFETPYQTARRIVCEEWHQAVKKYNLTPNSVTERVVGRIINRLDETAWPND